MYPPLLDIYNVINWHKNQKDHELGKSVGLFATLPSELSKQFPNTGKQGEDESPSHVTVCFIGSVPCELEDKIRKVAEICCNTIRPFSVILKKPKTFTGPDYKYILHSPVKSSKLLDLHDTLKRAFLATQIPIDNKFPEYKPHVTIAYCKDDNELEQYQDISPEGSFEINHLWLWGMGQPYLIHLGKKR